MIRLPNARDAWNTPGFNQTLKRELEEIDNNRLPLQQGLTLSSIVSSEPFSAIVLDSEAVGDTIRCRVSIIYSGIISGCSCADDPTPMDSQTEYCELVLEIDQASAEARVMLSEANR
jgi:hypothetical protein